MPQPPDDKLPQLLFDNPITSSSTKKQRENAAYETFERYLAKASTMPEELKKGLSQLAKATDEELTTLRNHIVYFANLPEPILNSIFLNLGYSTFLKLVKESPTKNLDIFFKKNTDHYRLLEDFIKVRNYQKASPNRQYEDALIQYNQLDQNKINKSLENVAQDYIMSHIPKL